MARQLTKKQRKARKDWYGRNKLYLMLAAWVLAVVVIEMVWWFAACNIALVAIIFFIYWYTH